MLGCRYYGEESGCEELRADEMLEEEGAEPRVYELGFHIDPELPVEEAKKTYQVIRELIEEKGALVAEGEPEKIPLAYTISRQEVAGRRDFDSAYFSWIAYETTPPVHAEILAAADFRQAHYSFHRPSDDERRRPPRG